MKIFKHTKRIKTRGIKLKRRFKIKLSVPKLQKHPGRKYTKMFTPQNMLNIVDDQNVVVPSTPLEENILSNGNISSFTERSRQLSPKHKKKQNKETAKKCFADDITNWHESEQQEKEDNQKMGISNDESKGEKDNDWAQVVSMEQRNLDSPIIVNMSLDDSTALSVPNIFEQRPKTQYKINAYDKNIFPRKIWSEEDKAQIIDSECVKPNDIHSLVEHEEFASPAPWDANEADKIKNNRATLNRKLKNIAIGKVSDINSIPARKGFVKISKRSTNNNNDVKMYESQLEDTSEFHYQSDLSSETENNATTSNSKLADIGSRDFKDTHSHKIKQPQLYSIRNIVIVIMEKDVAFGFTGKLLIKVLYGAVEVYGLLLNTSKGPTEVYSPKGYSNVVVKTCEEIPGGPSTTINDIWTALSTESITRDSETKLLEDINKIEPGTAVLMLRNIENHLTHFLKTNYPIRLFPDVKKSGYYSWTDHHRAEIMLQVHLQIKPQDVSRKGLSVNSHITNIANKMLARWRANSWSCALIAGGKNVGKSTNVRFLINKLLETCKKVVLVDVDPGQPECTPSRCISYSLIEQPLMGPNFTHLQMPVYQLFIDEIDVMQCIPRYLEAMKILITKLKSCPELSRLPIVVNTMGFTQLIGWDLMIFTIKLIRPSVILQIVSANNKKNYKSWLNTHILNKQDCKWILRKITPSDWNKPCDHEFIVIRSSADGKDPSKKWNMEPYQQRELAMISYLSHITRGSYDPFQCNEGLSLKINEAMPYKTSFTSLCIIPQRLFGVPPSHALSVINGNIVALCGIDLMEESSQMFDDTSDLQVLTHKTPLCSCYGFGIVRGIDVEQKEIFINTPLSISMMEHINCLAGCIPIPPSLLQVNEGAPYVGADAMLPTSRKPRKGYFRMRYRKKSKADNDRSSQEVV